MGIVLILLASAGAVAKAPHSAAIYPPFGATTTTSASTSSGGCGAERSVHPPSFNNANGLAQVAEAASSKTCPAALGGGANPSWSSISNAVFISWPIPIGSGGTHDVQFNATDREAASLKIWTSGVCPTSNLSYFWGNLTYGHCDAYAETNWGGSWWFYDVTNATILDGGPVTSLTQPFFVENSVVIDYGCYSAAYGGACFSYNSSYKTSTNSMVVSTGGLTQTYDNNWTFNGSHSYDLVWEGATEVNTDVYGWTSAHAQVSLNVASHGYGVKFHWINVL